MVTNSGTTNSGTTNPDTNSAASMIDSLIDTVLDELDGPIILRQIIRLFVVETDSSNDSVSAYSGALAKIRNISVESGSRMESTKKYAVRILKRNLKIYENIVYRNAVANSNNTPDSAGSGN